jgi:hypothetical protein
MDRARSKNGEERNTLRIVVVSSKGNGQLRKPRRR